MTGLVVIPLLILIGAWITVLMYEPPTPNEQEKDHGN